MISSEVFEKLSPLFKIIKDAKGKTIGELKDELHITHNIKQKGTAGLVVENILGVKNNSRPDADIPEIGCEIKILPLQINKNGQIKAKEPTAIQVINYMEVAKETWDTARIRSKINITFWVVYLAKKAGYSLVQDDYVIVDCFLDHPCDSKVEIFKKDWTDIQDYIIRGDADKLSCSMGIYIEPKTKGRDSQDKTDAPDGNGAVIKVRRRGFYFKKRYTNENIIPEIDTTVIEKDNNN